MLVHLVLQAQGLATKSQEPPILANHGEAGQPACGRVELGSFMLDTEVIVCCGCSCHWIEAAFAAVQVLAICEHSPALKPSTVVATPLPPAAAATRCCCCHLQRALFGGDCPPGLGVLPVTVYLDKTLQSIGGRQYYPMLIGFPTLPRESVFKHGCYERLALLPALEADPSISLKASSVRWST